MRCECFVSRMCQYFYPTEEQTCPEFKTITTCIAGMYSLIIIYLIFTVVISEVAECCTRIYDISYVWYLWILRFVNSCKLRPDAMVDKIGSCDVNRLISTICRTVTTISTRPTLSKPLFTLQTYAKSIPKCCECWNPADCLVYTRSSWQTSMIREIRITGS